MFILFDFKWEGGSHVELISLKGGRILTLSFGFASTFREIHCIKWTDKIRNKDVYLKELETEKVLKLSKNEQIKINRV